MVCNLGRMHTDCCFVILCVGRSFVIYIAHALVHLRYLELAPCLVKQR